jgi:hypothetical protein
MHEAYLKAAAAGLLDVLPLVFGELGDDAQAAATSAAEMMTRDRMPPL